MSAAQKSTTQMRPQHHRSWVSVTCIFLMLILTAFQVILPTYQRDLELPQAVGVLYITSASADTYLIDILLPERQVHWRASVERTGRASGQPLTIIPVDVHPQREATLTFGVSNGVAFTADLVSGEISGFPTTDGNWLRSTSASWSPDGRQAVHVVNEVDHDLEVWTLNTGQTQGIELEGSVPLLSAVWNPTGTHIALHGPSQQSLLTLSTLEAGCWRSNSCRQSFILPPTHVVNTFAWFPDGRHLVYAGYIDDRTTVSGGVTYTLWRVDRETGTLTTLLSAPQVERVLGAASRPTTTDSILPAQQPFFLNVAVSPDGQQVAFLFFSYTSTDPVATEVRLVFVELADGTLTPTDYVLQNVGAFTPVGLAWGPPLPEGVLPTPPSLTE